MNHSDARYTFGSRQHDTSGWSIVAHTAHICRDEEAEDLKSKLGAPSLPEQLFGNSYLRLTHHLSGCVLEFTAADALRQWHEDDEAPVQVASATQWQAARQESLSKVTTLQYDWTYSTSYVGSLRQFGSQNQADSCGEATTQARIQTWQPSSDRIDLGLLSARDPIQFYADVPLYESELDDNGTSQLSVKVRVMPHCWYVLLRFFLRIDSTLVRLREARLFCDLRQPNKIIRETKRSEASLAQLSGNALGSPGVAHADVETAAVALAAIAPNGVRAYSIDTLSLHTYVP